jgi:hypothetical protein
MKTVTKYLLGFVGVVTAVMQSPTVQAAVVGFVAAHPGISALVGGVSTILALLHNPSASS